MDEHYAALSALVRTVRTRWRAAAALRASTLAAASAAFVLGLALVAQRLVAPGGGALVALWLVAIAAALVCAGWFIEPLRRAPGEQQVARYIEECCPELEDTLVTAIVQGLASRPLSETSRRAGPVDPPSKMRAAVAADAVRRTQNLDLDRMINRRQLRQAGMRAAVATLLLCVVAGFAFGPVGRAARVLTLYLFPSRLALQVVPGDAKIRAGSPLRILARMPGAAGTVVPVLRVGEGADSREVAMDAAADGFATAFDHVDGSFRYTVTAAGSSSRVYAITVIRPPRVERIDLRYQYPPAFGMQPRQEDDGGDIYGPAGTRVHMVVHVDKPVTDAALTLTGGQRVALSATGGILEGDLTIVEDGSYRVALADGDGLSNPGDTEYFIRTLEDRPPDVRIVRPASDHQVTPIEEVPIEARADDDFGIAALDLVYAVRGAAPKAVPFRREGSGTSVNGTLTVYLEDLDVKPGDFVTYYARARDVSRGKRSSESRSDIFFLEVTPFEEEFVAAQSQGSGGASDQALEEMVQAQKEIITATWKLDTRAQQAGGRSADDIKTVGKAQRELRGRAVAAVAQAQRASNLRRVRPGGGRNQAPSDDPTAGAMSKAADAMARAEQQLEALKTTDALPHEMAALNELLRAQAEVRRREIQQQQANGNGRGANRQQQDLSSLFDRELARQQQTNYETPTSQETREAQPDSTDDPLEKIRELARRQDELNRQQQDAASKPGASEEEMRRQLEKLTREQTELRRQAEDLAQQLQQQQSKQSGQSGQGGQSGQSGRGGQSGQGAGGQGAGGQGAQGGRGQSDPSRQQASRDLQQISEEMQGAASELRRDNPKQASERGTRAAERLRDLEQRMRGAQPDDRRRALGEMQLESRQLADAQRQLASDAASQGRGGTSADASRRRAGEQERLADRTERLEQSVKQLVGAPGGEQRQQGALGEAARELERQRLSDRMRNAARADRQAGDGRSGEGRSGDGRSGEGRSAQPQQASPSGRETADIASALDRLAERLGSANGQSAASQQLSDELSKIRELREKLAQLDRQLAELKNAPSGDGQPQAGRSGQRGGERPGGQRGASAQNGDADRPWDDARQLLDQLRSEKSKEIESPAADGFNPGRSAPGTEGWKQDFAMWDTLKVQIASSLERAEATAAGRLRDQQSKDRLSAGVTQAVPEQYRRLVDKYYEALAASPKEKR